MYFSILKNNKQVSEEQGQVKRSVKMAKLLTERSVTKTGKRTVFHIGRGVL